MSEDDYNKWAHPYASNDIRRMVKRLILCNKDILIATSRLPSGDIFYTFDAIPLTVEDDIRCTSDPNDPCDPWDILQLTFDKSTLSFRQDFRHGWRNILLMQPDMYRQPGLTLILCWTRRFGYAPQEIVVLIRSFVY